MHYSFISDKALQLKEAPVANPIVHNPPSSLFPNAFEVFNYNLVSVEVGNNVFAYVVINPSHPTSFPTTKLFQQSLRRPCAFSLQFTTQILKLSFSSLDFSRIIKPAVRTDGKVIYSEVNAQNIVLRTNVLLSGINLFRECEQEKASSLFIHPKQAFFNIPREVFFVTSRDVEFELLPYFEQSQDKLIAFDVSTSWKVESDRSSFDGWLCFSLLDHSTSLSYASDSYLGWKFEYLSYFVIDSIMELEVFGNLILPSVIDTELKCLGVGFDSGNYLFSWIDSNFSTDIRSHNRLVKEQVFKCFDFERGEKGKFLPQLKQWVSFAHVL